MVTPVNKECSNLNVERLEKSCRAILLVENAIIAVVYLFLCFLTMENIFFLILLHLERRCNSLYMMCLFMLHGFEAIIF